MLYSLSMSEFRRLLQWFALALLFGGAGLSIFGAFLGAEAATRLFNAPPMVVFWIAFALALVVGLAAYPAAWRRPGLLGMHLGSLLILAGAMTGSGAGHRLAEKCGLPPRVRSGVLSLRDGETSADVIDPASGRVLGALPFALRLDAFEIERYPLPSDPPSLLYGVLEPEPGTPRFHWRTRVLEWKPGKTMRLAGAPIQWRVTEFTRPAENEPLSLTVELSADGGPRVHTLVCRPDEPFARLALYPVFPDLTNLDRSASLILPRPEAPVREYRSRLTVLRGGKARPAEVRVNHPLHVAGYHVYQQSWGSEPEPYTVLRIASDRGWAAVWMGFVLLGAGAAWHFWMRPPRRAEAAL